MDKVSSVIGSVLRRRGLRDHAEGALVVHRSDAWMSVNMAHVREFVVVRSFKDGVLLLACSNSVAAQECTGAIDSLLKDLRADCPFASIKSIRVDRS